MFKGKISTRGIHSTVHYTILFLIILFAIFINIIPHYNYETGEFYKYPVHVDEWMHYTYSRAVTAQDTVEFNDPFTGKELPFTPGHMIHERGYQTFIGVWQEISGIPWIWLFIIFPSLTFCFIILAVYIFAQRKGYGLEAALLATLIPTTLTFLGPGFVVPIAFSLIFLPISLWLIHNFKDKKAYFILAVIFCSLIIIHERGCAAVGMAVIATSLLTIREDWKHSAKTIATIAAPVIIALILYYPILQEMGLESGPYEWIMDSYEIYGYGAIALFLIGTGVMAFKWNPKNYGLLTAMLVYLLVIFLRVKMDIGVFTLSARWSLLLLLMMSIIGGYGLNWIWKNAKNIFSSIKKIKISKYSVPLTSLIVALVVLFTVVPSISAHLDKEKYSHILYYYHVIDDRDYDAFIWIRDNVNDSYERGIVEQGSDSSSLKSWRGIAFTPITGKYVYNWFHPGGPPPYFDKAKEFFDNNCNDTQFLIDNEISIVYSNRPIKNPDSKNLIQTEMKNVYLLNWELMKNQSF